MRESETATKWATYIDGFNFYYAIKQRLPDHQLYLGWCDFLKLSHRLVDGRGDVVAVKYFTAKVDDYPLHKGEAERQKTWLRAVRATRGVSIVEGFHTGKLEGGFAPGRKEKATDVNLALALLLDAAKRVYDNAILITGDYDQIPAVVAVTEEFDKAVEVWIPPGQGKGRWKEFAKHPRIVIREIAVEQLRKSRLPDVFRDSEGPILPPEDWQAQPRR